MRLILVLLVFASCDSPDDRPAVSDARSDGVAGPDAPRACGSSVCPDTLPPVDYACGTTELTGGPCGDVGASCYVEGTGTCDQPPAGGGCGCGDDGRWSCYSGCPEACPATTPAERDPCAGEITCRYQTGTVSCTCVSGAFDCVP